MKSQNLKSNLDSKFQTTPPLPLELTPPATTLLRSDMVTCLALSTAVATCCWCSWTKIIHTAGFLKGVRSADCVHIDQPLFKNPTVIQTVRRKHVPAHVADNGRKRQTDGRKDAQPDGRTTYGKDRRTQRTGRIVKTYINKAVFKAKKLYVIRAFKKKINI